MPAAQSSSVAPVDTQESHVLLFDVPWSTYVLLRDTVDSGGVRMTYLRGALEIARTSRRHEVAKTQIARLLELFCLERGIALYGYGSTTFRSEEKERGLEPDECYCREADRDVPDVAIEVVVTPAKIDKLEVYRGLGVREVWLFEAGRFLAHWAAQPDQAQALVGWRDELRAGA